MFQSSLLLPSSSLLQTRLFFFKRATLLFFCYCSVRYPQHPLEYSQSNNNNNSNNNNHSQNYQYLPSLFVSSFQKSFATSNSYKNIQRKEQQFSHSFNKLKSLSFQEEEGGRGEDRQQEEYTPATEEDYSRWERMYYGEDKKAKDWQKSDDVIGVGETNRNDINFEKVLNQLDKIEMNNNNNKAMGEIRVVTFDLDNTLWKTGETIKEANDALYEYLDSIGIKQPVRVEKVMGTLSKQDTSNKYTPLQQKEQTIQGGEGETVTSTSNDNNMIKPVLLTQLRKDAIRYILDEQGCADDANVIVEDAFEVWTNARHDAIPNYFATNVIETLQQIKSLNSRDGKDSNSNEILIGAITDGNSNPMKIDSLTNFFDFVVNSESVGIAKPDKRVYVEAMKYVSKHPFTKDLVTSSLAPIDYNIESFVGNWWVHIGDDFIKDIVASKSLKMRTIWCRELILPKLLKENDRFTQQEDDDGEKKLQDFVKQMSEMKMDGDGTITMEIGATDYISSSIEKEYSDAIVNKFDEVYTIIKQWNEEALDVKNICNDESSATATKESTVLSQKVVEGEDGNGVALAGDGSKTSKTASERIVGDSATSHKQEQKFCVYCGTKLPIVAKFCSSCGEKQP